MSAWYEEWFSQMDVDGDKKIMEKDYIPLWPNDSLKEALFSQSTSLTLDEFLTIMKSIDDQMSDNITEASP